MSILSFLKLQWVKRKIIIILITVVSLIQIFFLSNYRSVQFKVMNILAGDHYYTSFTVMMPAEDEMTGLVINEVKGWTGVENVHLVNTQKIMKQIQNESKQFGLELPSLVTDEKTVLYAIQIDPFLDKNLVEAIKAKILSNFSTNKVLASPIKYAEIASGNYNFLTLFFMENGFQLILLLLTLAIVGSNAILFYKMVNDAYILQSINRKKALSLKNYLFFQLSILILAIIFLAIIVQSISLLTVLIWLTTQSVLAFIFYGIWGRNYQL